MKLKAYLEVHILHLLAFFVILNICIRETNMPGMHEAELTNKLLLRFLGRKMLKILCLD